LAAINVDWAQCIHTLDAWFSIQSIEIVSLLGALQGALMRYLTSWAWQVWHRLMMDILNISLIFVGILVLFTILLALVQGVLEAYFQLLLL